MASENYILLERTELNATAASVTFSNIPQSGYTDLKIVISSRTNRANAVDSLGFYFNGDATVARYSGRVLYGTGSSAASNAPSPVDDETMFTAGNNATASTFGNSELYIPNYTSSNQKSASVDSVGENNATTARMNISAILYNQTTAISSVTFIPITGTTILEGSTFSLYGIAAVGTTPVIAPKASGGNIIDFDGTYWIHTFLTSGTFTPLQGLSCDYLVVAGGGGGGSGTAGGGGAGGYLTGTGFAVTSGTPIAVTVGAGGTTPGAYPGTATAGANSVFSSITSAGGGAGATNATIGGNGGSGGGGGGNANIAGGTATPAGQGNNGGAANSNNSAFGAGGGGGASAVGGTGTNSTGGAGGNGTANSISGTSITYAGGGGGGAFTAISPSTGGTGGGGNGGVSGTAGQNGTVNRGGGGGGGGANSANGGNGGAGIVIIRYPA
jgi:hypothetical protein